MSPSVTDLEQRQKAAEAAAAKLKTKAAEITRLVQLEAKERELKLLEDQICQLSQAREKAKTATPIPGPDSLDADPTAKEMQAMLLWLQEDDKRKCWEQQKADDEARLAKLKKREQERLDAEKKKQEEEKHKQGTNPEDPTDQKKNPDEPDMKTVKSWSGS